MIKHPLYKNGNVYLSGGIQHAHNGGLDWRAETSGWLKDQGYYPIDIGHLNKIYEIRHGKFLSEINEQEHLQRKSNIRKHIIEADLALIKNDSDAIIIYYDESVRKGAGSISECMFAYIHDIPVFIVSAWNDWVHEVPGWLQALSTRVFGSFYELETYFSELPPGIIKRDIYGNRHVGDKYLCSLTGEVFSKNKIHYVSKVSPLYCKEAVELVKETCEEHKDRYQFIVEFLEQEAEQELMLTLNR